MPKAAPELAILNGKWFFPNCFGPLRLAKFLGSDLGDESRSPHRHTMTSQMRRLFEHGRKWACSILFSKSKISGP